MYVNMAKAKQKKHRPSQSLAAATTADRATPPAAFGCMVIANP